MPTTVKENYLKALYFLNEKDGRINVTELSKRLGVSKPTASNMVKSLEEEGQPGTYRKTEQFTGALFVDAGILDPEAFSADADELRASLGFSISLWLGLPLTLSFAWPLEEGREDEKQVFRFDIGLR